MYIFTYVRCIKHKLFKFEECATVYIIHLLYHFIKLIDPVPELLLRSFMDNLTLFSCKQDVAYG